MAILCPVHGNGSWEGSYRGARCCAGTGAGPKITLIRDHPALSQWGLPRNGVLQRVALILTRTRHARRISRVEFLAGQPVGIMRNGSSTLKSAVGSSHGTGPLT
jgi:hypothetical protein